MKLTMVELIKMVAVNFAEWLSENEWVKRKERQTHPNKVGQYYSHKHCEYKTIDELYELFKVDEKNRLETEN